MNRIEFVHDVEKMNELLAFCRDNRKLKYHEKPKEESFNYNAYIVDSMVYFH